jgi:glycine cleavage system H lipoate-binding protein/TusA-related sulfurtransferase
MSDKIHIDDQLYGCYLPLDYMYDTENSIWVHLLNNDLCELGLLPMTQVTMGKIKDIKMRSIGSIVQKGQPLLSIEARRFSGYIYSPFTGIIEDVNQIIINEPWKAQTIDYKNNWILKMKLHDLSELSHISNGVAAVKYFEDFIKKHNIVCFKIPPDYVYPAIGMECSQLIIILSDIMSHFPLNSIIHIVADYNPGSEHELLEWEKVTGHKVLEVFIEKITTKGLIHGLIQKTH